ncbi:MAG: hypothetical protein KDB53_10595, partial [Planctomycetes bacterium]|nr:hypothetical protein [Planctomycetota bacterium]
TGVAYLGVVAKSQKTKEWRTEEVLAGAFLESKNHDAAELWWDSTRALHTQFSLGRGAISAGNWQDDVFPPALRFVFTLTEEGLAAGDAVVLGDLTVGQRNLRISDPELFADLESGEAAAMRLGDEWVEVQQVDGRELKVRRGIRQTRGLRHPAGTPVVVGRSFQRTIAIPAYRSWFRGPGEQGR